MGLWPGCRPAFLTVHAVSTAHGLVGSLSSIRLLFRINAARKGSSGFKSYSSPPWPRTSTTQPQPALHTRVPCVSARRKLPYTSGSGGHSLQLPPCCGTSSLSRLSDHLALCRASLEQWLRHGHHSPAVTCGPHHTYRHGPQTASPQPLLGRYSTGLCRAHGGLGCQSGDPLGC